MNVLALIPARGGSKGIPHKNSRLLAGKPLVAHTVEQARAARLVQRVVVSTDDEAIAAASRAYGAEIIWRPAEISGDTASSESALVHALDWLWAQERYEPDWVLFLQATSPLRGRDDIDNAIQTVIREEADSLLSVTPSHAFLWRVDEAGAVSVNYDYRTRPRRQDRAPEYRENGSLYLFKPWVLRQTGNRLGGKIALYPMHPYDSWEIDDLNDWQLVEQLYVMRRNAAAVNLAAIQLLIFDFDGVMSDNRVLVDENGKEAVWVSRSDGWGIARLRATGLPMVVLSTEKNPVVAARCQKLGLRCLQGHDDKLPILQALAQELGIDAAHIAYVGNDLNDLSCLSWVGVPIVVQDAHPSLHPIAQWVTQANGGQGAVREICDALYAARG